MPKMKNVRSFSDATNHIYDDYKNRGYAYERHILMNVLSPELFGNTLNDASYRQIERLMECLIDAVRKIKLTYCFAFDKDSKLIN